MKKINYSVLYRYSITYFLEPAENGTKANGLGFGSSLLSLLNLSGLNSNGFFQYLLSKWAAMKTGYT